MLLRDEDSRGCTRFWLGAPCGEGKDLESRGHRGALRGGTAGYSGDKEMSGWKLSRAQRKSAELGS